MRYKHLQRYVPLVLGPTFFAGYLYGKKRNESDMLSKNFNSTTIIKQQIVSPNKKNEFMKTDHIVLIDWDNCLCNTFPTIQKRLSLVASKIEQRHPECNIDRCLLRKPWTQEFSEHLKSIFGDDYCHEAQVLYFEYMDHKDVPPKKPFPGAEDLLRALLKERIPFVIVSNSSTKLVKHGIELFGWNDIFEDCPIIASDSVSPRTKPDPYHFMTAIKSLYPEIQNSGITEVVIIGDGADSDMLGALNLANVLSEHNIAVSAIWMTHSDSIKCRLRSFSSFIDLQKELIPSREYQDLDSRTSLRRHK
ncbi:MAG: HAD hydrolase-like protein [Gammaproteobacteria bacterium]|nr:HAD hydrolase-like protein [Gammaproteobacteria bacterium]